MCQENEPNTAPRTAALAVDWHHCEWVPAIVVQTPPVHRRRTKPLPGHRPVSNTDRHASITFKTMKLFSSSARRPRAGFTLIELLVVIAIIGILAAMLLAVLPGVTNAGKKTKAKLEAQSIATAIEQYDSAYGRFPVSSAVQTSFPARYWRFHFYLWRQRVFQ